MPPVPTCIDFFLIASVGATTVSAIVLVMGPPPPKEMVFDGVFRKAAFEVVEASVVPS
jgi:hypothetical protein